MTQFQSNATTAEALFVYNKNVSRSTADFQNMLFCKYCRCMLQVTRNKMVDCENESEDLVYTKSEEFENVIITNDSSALKDLLKDTNVNLPLNERGETALILAVKLSNIDMVKALLKHSACDKNYVNISTCSALDLALVTAFDNRLEPRHSICWQIIALLLDSQAEPMCKDAMMYVIRTALKFEDSDFINRVIDTCLAQATSLRFHELLLQKLHRHQPIYAGIIDPFLQRASDYTVKLLKIVSRADLKTVINSFEYYMDSHWADKETKASVFQKLILYASGAGWHYSNVDIGVMKKIHRDTAIWCKRYGSNPSSLMHQCRIAFRCSVSCFVPDALKHFVLPEAIKSYILLSDVDCLFYENVPLNRFMF